MDDFQYLGSHIASTEKDVHVRLTKAWAALNKMNIIWKSNLSHNLKIQFFKATVESILLYGSGTWTLTKSLETRLNGNYTRMLRTVQNISWKDKILNEELYESNPKISNVVKERRLRFAGLAQREGIGA